MALDALHLLVELVLAFGRRVLVKINQKPDFLACGGHGKIRIQKTSCVMGGVVMWWSANRGEHDRTLKARQHISLKGAHRLGRLRNRVEVDKGETSDGAKADKAGQRGKQALHLLERAVARYVCDKDR
jgi:hypothetical protein